MYACDERWWNVHLKNVHNIFKGKKYYKVRNAHERKYAADNGLTPIEGRDGQGLGRNGVIHFGSNSGYQAINLAYLLATEQGYHPRILLLGYDMQSTGGKAHWFGDHPKGLSQGNYQSFVPRFDSIARDLQAEGVEVINCTRQTALTQFRLGVIEDYV